MYKNIKKKLKVITPLKKVYSFLLKWIRFAFKVVQNILGYFIILPVAFLFPKKNLVVLSSRFGDFEGNLKYLYLALKDSQSGSDDGLEVDSKTEIVFITEKKKVYQQLKSKGYKVWKSSSVLTCFRMMSAKVLIVDGNEWASGFKYFLFYTAKTVQIWHGTGLKAIGLLKPNYQALGPIHKFFRKEKVNYDLLCLSSEDQVKNRGKAFKYQSLLINGLPRNDVFFNEAVLRRSVAFDGADIESYRNFKKEGYAIVTYTPTWRKYQESLHQLNLEKLNAVGEKHRIKWVIKLHYKHDIPVSCDGLDHVLEYEKTADIYPLLALSDLLITDYSSIYLDYLLLDKPIVFFPYDEAEYIDGERSLLLDYSEVTPGPKVYTQQALEEEVCQILLHQQDDNVQGRQQLRKSFFKYQDGQSTQRLWNNIKEKYLS